VAFTYLKLKSAKCLLFTSGGFGLGLKNLVLFTSLPDPLAGGACCPPREIQYKVHDAFVLDFRPFRPHLAASFNSLHFPQCIRGLIETLLVPIHGAKECIRMQDFVLKIYQKIPGVTTPGPPQQKGRHLFAPTPVPTCQMLVPLRFF